MSYDSIIELDNVTLEDCLDLCKMKNIYTLINDGRIINFVNSEEKFSDRKN